MAGPSRTLALLVLACCKSSAPGPATKPAPQARVATAEPTATSTPDIGAPGVTLSSTPIHQQLLWLVDVLGKRNGVVERDELEQHCEKKLLGPVGGMSQSVRGWATDAAGLSVEKLEVDDPTYVRAILVARDKRHLLIMTIDETSSKIDYVRYEDQR